MLTACHWGDEIEAMFSLGTRLEERENATLEFFYFLSADWIFV